MNHFTRVVLGKILKQLASEVGFAITILAPETWQKYSEKSKDYGTEDDEP